MANELTIKWERMNEEGDVYEELLPAKYVVCSNCKGLGYHPERVRTPNEDEYYGPDYFARMCQDPTCEECQGKRVVLIIDEDACDLVVLRDYFKHLDEEASYQTMCRMEQMMGA